MGKNHHFSCSVPFRSLHAWRIWVRVRSICRDPRDALRYGHMLSTKVDARVINFKTYNGRRSWRKKTQKNRLSSEFGTRFQREVPVFWSYFSWLFWITIHARFSLDLSIVKQPFLTHNRRHARLKLGGYTFCFWKVRKPTYFNVPYFSVC